MFDVEWIIHNSFLNSNYLFFLVFFTYLNECDSPIINISIIILNTNPAFYFIFEKSENTILLVWKMPWGAGRWEVYKNKKKSEKSMLMC